MPDESAGAAHEARRGDVTLSCQPAREGDALVFPYRIQNGGAADLYVFTALPERDPATGAFRLNHDTAYVALGADGFAHVLRGIAPLPPDSDVTVRLIPLAARVAPGAALDQKLTLTVPLHETSPYHPDLPIRQYRQRPIQGIVLTVQYLAADTPGFSAIPAEHAPGLFRVATLNTVGSTRSLSCRLPARGLTILERTDTFPRPE
jgi:hypothetical protein